MPFGLLQLLAHQPATPGWDPITYFGTDLDSFWDTLDISKFSLTGSIINTWTPTVGSRIASKVSTGANYSATARNGLPGVVFTGNTAERMSFSATGLPSGAPNVTLVVVGFAANNTNSKTALSYGNGTGGDMGMRSLQIAGSPSGVQRTTGQYFVPTNGFSTVAMEQAVWQNNDRICIGEFFSTSIQKQSVDGDSNMPSYPYAGATNVSTSKGRIGVYPTDTSPWDGVLQGLMIIRRTLTQIEKDKLSVWLGNRYGLASNISVLNPYRGTAPSVASTVSSDLLENYTVQWSDGFTSLSLRTGGYYISDTTGYNDPTSKGTWSPDGLNYMNSAKGYPGFGQDWFVNPNFNWQALDATFPPLGMIDITANGVVLFGSEGYPAVRGSVTALSSGPPYLGALISTTQSAKIGIPFARRMKWTINSTRGEYSFPATWSLGDRYDGTMNFTGDISGTTLNVSALGFFPAGQSLKAGVKLSGGAMTANTRILSQSSGTPGGIGVYVLNVSSTVTSQALQAFYPHQEMDDMEQFGAEQVYNLISQHNHVLIDGVDVGRGINFTMNPSTLITGGSQVETVCVTTADFIYYMANGIITARQAWQPGSIQSDVFHAILNMSTGLSFEPYPGRFTGAISDGAGGVGNILTVANLTSGHVIIQAGQTISLGGVTQGVVQTFGSGGTTGTGGTGTYLLDNTAKLVAATPMQAKPALTYTPQITVRSVEFLAPVSNTSGTFPPAPPVPVITWGGGFTGGAIPTSTSNGTTVATLSGASTYTLLDYNGAAPSGLTVSGSNVVTSGSLSAGTFDFYIRGVDVSGVPGIAPKLTAIISSTTTTRVTSTGDTRVTDTGDTRIISP